MPTQAELDEFRARFEAARCFEDDDNWFPPKTFKTRSAQTSRRATLTTVFNPAHRKLVVQAPALTSKPRTASKLKWEPSVSPWEPSREYAPGEISGYGGGENAASWMDGWRMDEYGRPVKIIGGDGWRMDEYGRPVKIVGEVQEEMGEEDVSQWTHSRGESTVSTSGTNGMNGMNGTNGMNGEFFDSRGYSSRSAVRRSQDARLWHPAPRAPRGKNKRRGQRLQERAEHATSQHADTMPRPAVSDAILLQDDGLEVSTEDAPTKAPRGRTRETHRERILRQAAESIARQHGDTMPRMEAILREDDELEVSTEDAPAKDRHRKRPTHVKRKFESRLAAEQYFALQHEDDMPRPQAIKLQESRMEVSSGEARRKKQTHRLRKLRLQAGHTALQLEGTMPSPAATKLQGNKFEDASDVRGRLDEAEWLSLCGK